MGNDDKRGIPEIMPQRNKRQPIGVLGGDSGSLRNTGATEPPLQGATPDVSFSDTSLPVFADQFQVSGNWNIRIDGLDQTDINPIWAFENGMQNTGEEVVLTFTPGSTSSTLHITFPPNSNGKLRVEISANSVVSAVDNITKGPPSIRFFEIEFDTRVSAENAGGAELTLNKPLVEVWKDVIWTQKFTFTKAVGEFTAEDVRVRLDTTIRNDLKGELTQDPNDNKIFYMPITLEGSGVMEVSVDANVAITSSGHGAPIHPIAESWKFDAMPVNFEITDGAGSTDNIEIIHTETVSIDANIYPEFLNNGGSFLSVSDMKVFGDKLYFSSQIQRKREVGDRVSTLFGSAGALVSVPISGGNPTIHKKYNFFTQGARSLEIHGDNLYLFEGSAYIYEGSAQPNFTIVNVGKDLGEIQKIDAMGNMESLGLNWRSSFPTGIPDKYDGRHGGTFSPLVSHDGELHLISQQKDFFGANGVQWIVYSNKLNQRISLLETNDKTGFEVIERIAGLTNSIIGYEKGIFIFKPRNQPKDNPKIIDAMSLSRPINDMDIESDGTIVYNHVITKYANNQIPRTNYLTFPTLDGDSILANGEREFDLELPLDYHQKQWAVFLAARFLQEYKDLRFYIKLVLKRDLEISLGDIVSVIEPVIEDMDLIAQVMSVSQLKKTEETEITIVSVNAD